MRSKHSVGTQRVSVKARKTKNELAEKRGERGEERRKYLERAENREE
jgi:hypothetical protein